MKQTLQRGFTLIELLVVIAIIGILAAVVLGSLNDARDGGQDASIKQSMASARTTAEIFYNQQGFTYVGVCADPAIANLMQAAADNRAETNGGTGAEVVTGAASTDNQVVCNDAADGSGYAITAPVNVVDGTNVLWCIDSTGSVGLVPVDALSGATDISCS